MPLQYKHMWVVTESLWKPLRSFARALDGVFSLQLEQRLNPYCWAPAVNAVFAVPVVYIFLFIWKRSNAPSRDAGVATDFQSVAEHVEKVRNDFPEALHETPHPILQSVATIEEARGKVSGSAYFQGKTGAEHEESEDIT